MKKSYYKFCDLIAQACGAFAVTALLLSILIIVELVFERYFFQRAITWQTELVTMLLVASTFIGSAYVLSEKAHVSMEWIYDFLSKKNIIRLKIFTSFLSLLFFFDFILFWFFNGRGSFYKKLHNRNCMGSTFVGTLFFYDDRGCFNDTSVFCRNNEIN